MKLFLLSICLLCLIGCGKGDNRQREHRVVYPALTESPPPPMPVTATLTDEPAKSSKPQIPSNAPVEASWMEKIVKKEALIKTLTKQASQADPDDPFALSEEDIKALSEMDNLEIY